VVGRSELSWEGAEALREAAERCSPIASWRWRLVR
jgi:hypothetical protein